MDRILVTGTTGNVGTMVLPALREIAATVAVTSIGRDAGVCDVLWSPGDPVPQGLRADCVIALWGVTPGPDKDLMDNVKLAASAQSLAQQVSATRVLHCSSAAVYRPSTDPATEATPVDPQNDYGRAKVAMEEAVAKMPGHHCCLRIGNVAGADSLFAAIKRGASLTLDQFENGHGPERSYIAPTDLARVLAHLATMPAALPPVLNVAAPKATAMQAIADAAGRTVHWRPAPNGANQIVGFDTTLLQSICPLPENSTDADWLVQDWRKREI
ncbi:NAD-dependent epimerase/dehydratase family protein [Pseudoprimorskyibacter insulae]|uniref:NAD-dependent epimerase/dehydratase domain-containing protein n=1 Tax=Pseudoprimorskyibacter insulae TaxID=1695997 RepID=A0A2R8ATP2_9RHOB|nr:NAD(P)-dependent oxidoreductase [Pseudoprimorskyibacter insulae]SPF79432.1 hypothetical protein PRI8871_01228 [Pseudoprimorskyibacter insulae]